MRRPLIALLLLGLAAGAAAQAPGPTIDGLEPAEGESVPGSTPIAARFRDADGVDTRSARLELDGRDVTSLASVGADAVRYQPSSPLALGKHVARVRVADALGNAAEASWSFSVAAAAPTVVFLAPASNSVISNDTTVSVRLEDDQGLSEMRAEVDGREIAARHWVQGRALVPRVAHENVTIPVADLPDGPHVLTVTVVDVHAQTGSGTLPFEVSRAPARVPSMTPFSPQTVPAGAAEEAEEGNGVPVPWWIALVGLVLGACSRRPKMSQALAQD